MDKNELERRLESAEKQVIGLQEEIQNLKEKLGECEDGEIPEFPVLRHGEDYWFADDTNEVEYSKNCGCYENTDFNVFHTPEMAQEYAEKCKLIAMMLHCKWYLCRGFKGDYSDSNDKWVVYYGGLDNKFIATNSIHCDYGFVPFDTMENAQKCAEWLNDHWKEVAE